MPESPNRNPNPNPSTALTQRAPMSSRLQSPTGSFFLESNDDQLERVHARAARAAAIRRRNAAATQPSDPPDPCLEKEQIIELFQNCIKLASENVNNKINQKNTWELKLIDHLSEIIRVDAEEYAETNFQKASCTLEAGVKIYSLRVDSVHSEAYKILGGINRAGLVNEQETLAEGDNNNTRDDEGHSKEEPDRKISPLSTLESSFEALNVKRFDVVFTVDPLYHQTSAQFDEGGAKGLLLNNLSVYGGCRVLFDSLEVPGKCILCSSENNCSDMVDISFAKEYIEQMVMNMPEKNEISPTLRDIICLFNEENQQSSHTFSKGQKSEGSTGSVDENHVELNGNLFGNYEAWTFNHDNGTTVTDDDFTFGDPTIHIVITRLENVAAFLFQGLGSTSKKNVWAGPDHWKFQKSKGSEDVHAESGSSFTKKRPKNKKITELDISFTKSLVKEAPDVFAPKNPKLLLLPASREPCGNTLTEDCHYQPEDLVKLFLLPKVMCLGKRRRQLLDDQENNDDDRLPSWDNGSVFNCQYDDGYADSDVENLDVLVSQPRQVNKIEVQYDKTSKQVDVHILKKTLWDHMQESIQTSEVVYNNAISFKHILSTFPDDCQAAKAQDISPHLCFICLLHLANEHGLNIYDCPNLDDLIIQLPPQSQNTGDVMLSLS